MCSGVYQFDFTIQWLIFSQTFRQLHSCHYQWQCTKQRRTCCFLVRITNRLSPKSFPILIYSMHSCIDCPCHPWFVFIIFIYSILVAVIQFCFLSPLSPSLSVLKQAPPLFCTLPLMMTAVQLTKHLAKNEPLASQSDLYMPIQLIDLNWWDGTSCRNSGSIGPPFAICLPYPPWRAC